MTQGNLPEFWNRFFDCKKHRISQEIRCFSAVQEEKSRSVPNPPIFHNTEGGLIGKDGRDDVALSGEFGYTGCKSKKWGKRNES